MNRSKIEWCDHTWNPITGCLHNCEYCYARKMAARFSGDVRLNKMCLANYRTTDEDYKGQRLYILDAPMINETGHSLVYPFGFEPTFHRYRLDIPSKLKMGNNIFVGAMADIFGEWVPDEWIREIFDVCMGNPIHNYLFLTKNPERYIQYGIPAEQENLWYGTTITCDSDSDRIVSLIIDAKTFVSIEPLHERISKENIEAICRIADWIIIGAETGRNKNKIIPGVDWIKDIVAEADIAKKPVFMKDSLIPVVGEENMRRDFPMQLQHSEISPKMKEKLFAACAGCKTKQRKNEMITLLARTKRGEQPKQFAFLCKECFGALCEKWGVKNPWLKKMEDKHERTTD